MHLYEVAWLALRVGYSIVFLNAAWQCGKNRAGLEWTINESRILFGNAAPLFGPLGVLVMGAGGLSIVLGAWAELAGLAFFAFLLMGAVIHLRHRDRAAELGQALKAPLNPDQGNTLTQLVTSAQLAHYSSAIKNLSLAGPAVFFAIMGSGPLSLARLWGLAAP